MKPPYLPWASGEFRCGTDVAPQSNSPLDRLQLYFAQRGAACKRVASNHTAERIQKATEEMLAKWDINKDQVHVVMRDNAANMKKVSLSCY